MKLVVGDTEWQRPGVVVVPCVFVSFCVLGVWLCGPEEGVPRTLTGKKVKKKRGNKKNMLKGSHHASCSFVRCPLSSPVNALIQRLFLWWKRGEKIIFSRNLRLSERVGAIWRWLIVFLHYCYRCFYACVCVREYFVCVIKKRRWSGGGGVAVGCLLLLLFAIQSEMVATRQCWADEGRNKDE